jgi:serine/threonine protein kinase
LGTLQSIVKVLGPECLALLTGTEPGPAGAPQEYGTVELGEWDVDQVLTPWTTATNGLQYRICRLRHRLDGATLARGKCYELGHLADAEKERLRECFVRHALICRRIDRHPRVPINERMFHNDPKTHYWVVDKWEPCRTLADVLANGPLAAPDLFRVLREVAEGLQVLHDHDIIRRELAPRFVGLRDADGSVLLTDFELGKLLDGRPTVSASWPEDPYRAPEVGSPDLDARADVYSWGRMFVHAACGHLPAAGQEASALADARLPRGLKEVVLRSVALPRSDRPESMAKVLRRLPG